MNSTPRLKVPEFPFSSPLTTYAIALERHRLELIPLLEHNNLLLELAHLRRFMASIASARIEGNHTTVVEAVSGAREARTNPKATLTDNVAEIINLEAAADFIDQHVNEGTPLTHGLIRMIHELAVKDLKQEGDDTPGDYRKIEVEIMGSDHRPPLASTVHAHMTDLLDFVNEPSEPHYQLVRMAVAHHRFVWIHPFGNGNGRVARLFSYAMLKATGFASHAKLPWLNPTAVFGSNRDDYYTFLAKADSEGNAGLVEWSTYVLGGLNSDMEKLFQIARGNTLQEIIVAAADRAEKMHAISAEAAQVIRISSDGEYRKASDFETAIPGSAANRSRIIGTLIEHQILMREGPGKRRYRIQLGPNMLMPYLFEELDKIGFLPAIVRDPH